MTISAMEVGASGLRDVSRHDSSCRTTLVRFSWLAPPLGGRQVEIATLLSHTLEDEESADFLLTSIAEPPSSKLHWEIWEPM
jgi:hypothetical protein